MKKKSRILVHIALIALSLCIMVYGVYSAKNASMSIQGTIGFEAHGADIALTKIVISGSSTTATVKNGTTAITNLTAPGIANIDGKTINITNLAFKDDGTSANSWKPVTKITIAFTFKNTSKFAVTCTVPTKPTNATGKVLYNSAISTPTLSAETGETTVTITLTCDAIESFSATEFTYGIQFAK